MNSEGNHRGTRRKMKRYNQDSVKLCSKILLLSLFIVGCDLFNGPVQPDFLKKIDEEIAWSNAAKLTVRVDYPGGWGASNPSSGQIAPSPMDIRKGYAFELEFTPDIAYRFVEWRAYDTSVLNELGGDWRVNPTLLDGVPQLSGVGMPALPARGGKGEITIDTVTPVTLVPWCKTEPYVIRTEPRNEGRNSTVGMGYHPSTAVVAYFNTALDPEMAWGYGTGMVEIKARTIGSIPNGTFEDWSEKFETPLYESRGGQYTVTMAPKASNMPIPGYQIEVTVGPSIRNVQGEIMTSPEVFYYRVSELEGVDASIASWNAIYNSGGTISVSCTINGTDAPNATAIADYQMNQGTSQRFALVREGNSNTFTGTITGAGSVDASGIRDGRSASGMREYRIFIELNAGGYRSDGDDFKVWNFPGMSVSNTNQTIEIFTAAELAAIPDTGLGRQYVLANDITVTGHNPIGTSSAPFTGKFYGNGHTITINSFTNSQYTGLFGYTNNALIRDLTVAYNTSIASNAVIQYLGGVTGYADGSTEIRNIITSGTLNAGLNNTAAKYIGGITGYMANTVTIANIRAGHNLTVNATGSNSVYFGGITGDTGTGGTLSHVAMREVRITGTLTHEQNGSGAIYIGGVAGWFRASVTVSDIEFSGKLDINNRGTGITYAGGFWGNLSAGIRIEKPLITGAISCTATTAMIYCGGGIGRAIDAGTLTDFYSLAPSISATSTGNINAGGLIGALENGTSLTRCYAKTEVYVFGNGTVSAGGLVGNAAITSGTTSVSQCYATGAVIAEAENTINLCAGGLIGYYGGSGTTITVTDSYALGNVSADNKTIVATSATYAGGLVGHFTSASGNSGIKNCFAAGDVRARSNNEGARPFDQGGFLYVAGLVGRINTASTGFLLMNAAIGRFVTSMGGGNGRWYSGRVFGSSAGIPDYINNIHNYALSDMMIEVNHFYAGTNFGGHWNGSGDEPSIGYYYINSPEGGTSDYARETKYGRSTDYSYFFATSFWASITQSSTDIWNTLSAVSRGYPTLRNVGGQ